MTAKVNLIAGVDEAGRGPLAGSVFAAAVILDAARPISGLMDSKKLSEKKRIELESIIKRDALCWSVASASVEEIDEINILQATLLAMTRALDGLSLRPDEVLIDGNQVPRCDYACQAIVKGDALFAQISAASILAKQARDAEMYAMAKQYPKFAFDKHKGYPTKAHREALLAHGVTPIHRRSYAPVQKILEQMG